MSLPFRRVSASRALHWWAEGWRGFRRAPMAWVGLSVALLVALALLGMLPFGRLLAQWLSVPLFALGAVYAALLQRRARDVQRVLPEVLVEEARTDGVFDDSARLWRRRIGPLLLASLFVLLLGGAFSVAFVVLSAAALGVGLAGFGALGALGGGFGLLA